MSTCLHAFLSVGVDASIENFPAPALSTQNEDSLWPEPCTLVCLDGRIALHVAHRWFQRNQTSYVCLNLAIHVKAYCTYTCMIFLKNKRCRKANEGLVIAVLERRVEYICVEKIDV
jgi:hypothetical protein